MMEDLWSRAAILVLLPLIALSWNGSVQAIVVEETGSVIIPKDASFQPELHVTRAEAAEQFALALELPVPAAKPKYRDVGSSHWAKNYIAAATKAGLFDGYPDGSFQPDQAMTRGQMAKVLVIAYKHGGSAGSSFTDISGSWAKDHISSLAANGIVTGFPDGTFRPHEPITREDFSLFLVRASNQGLR